MVDQMTQTAVASADGLSGSADISRFQREQSHLFEYRRQIRNLLAIIRATVRRTARGQTSVEDFAALLEGRLGALARVQDMLMRVPEGGADLMEVVSAEFLAQGVPEERVAMNGASLPLSGKVAASLALALHELTTNAIKFGALSAPQGRVSVSWRENEDDGFTHLAWREAGVPIVLTAPPGSGFGMELLGQTLPYELGARTTIEFAPGGLGCVIEFRARKPRGETL